MSKLFTKDEIQHIKKYYGEKSASEIANDLNRTVSSIYHKANRLGLITKEREKTDNAGKQWTDEDLLFLKTNYSSMTTYELQEKLGRSRDAIQLMAAKLGEKKSAKAISLTSSLQNNQVNHNYFKTWSHNMAYILGLIYADGNLVKGSNGISIGLHQQDIDVLEKIKLEIESDNEISPSNNFCVLHINSAIVREDLEKLGLMPSKSLSITFPEIPNAYLADFIRGYFDGDGTITPASDRPRITIYSGSEEFLRTISETILKNFKIPSCEIYKDKRNNTYALTYNGINALDFGKAIYESADICIQRKMKRHLLQEKKNRCKYNKWIERLKEGKLSRGLRKVDLPNFNRYLHDKHKAIG